MKTVQLGRTPFCVTRLCFGTLTLSPLQRDLPPRKGADLLLAAFERGVNFLDTAELYDNYEAIGLALSEWRGHDIVVQTKCYAYDAAGAEKSLETALRALGRERIEIFMLHEQESAHTLRGHAEALEAFAKARDAGKIGAIGISTHYVAGVQAAARHPLIEVVHPIYNVVGMGIVDGARADMEAAVQTCNDAGRGIVAMKPLGGGHLISDRERAFDYALHAQNVDSIALGMQSEAEIDYACALFDGRDASPFAETTASQPRTLAIHSWCVGCGACAERCQQKAIRIENGKACVTHARCVLCGYCASACPEFCIKVI